jgi:two-component system, OmpR family, heavy metal sensor histidine kinase CusS
VNSFRIKIALLSGLISGVLLVGASWILWQQTHRTNLAQIDRELRNLGHGNLERRHGHMRFIQLDQALNFLSATNSEYILHFETDFGRGTHTSTNWPETLDPESFGEITKYPRGVEVDPNLLTKNKPPKGFREGKNRPVLPLKLPRFETRTIDGRSWRLATMGNPVQTLIIGVDIARFETGLNRLRITYLTLIPIVLLLVGIGSWLLAGRALRPVNILTGSVENITARGLSQRLESGAHDEEFGRLITVFNEMLDRLQKSFYQATRFSADASHELKTPLAIMQGELEQALQHAEDSSDAQRIFGQQLEEIQRLKIITQKLLLLSRADAGQLVVNGEQIHLSEMIAEIAEDADILAPHLDVKAEIKPDIYVDADRVLLLQVLQNLISNAVKYNHENGWVHMRLEPNDGKAIFRISNSGPGIATEDRVRVFDRFHRADDSRNRTTEGVGLGLSLCREIVRAHDGELVVADSDEKSATFELTLTVIEP